MKAEFSAMWTLLYYANMLDLRKMQVFGDSKVVIDWANRRVQIQVVKLQPLLNHNRNIMDEFEWSSFNHVYRKLNEIADGLSKEALELDPGSFIVQEYFDGLICDEKYFL